MSWLSPAAVAKRLGVSKSMVYKEIAAGRLRAYRIGRRLLRIKEHDFDTYCHQLLENSCPYESSGKTAPAAPSGKPTYPTSSEVSRELNAVLGGRTPGAAPKSGNAPSSPKRTTDSSEDASDAYSGRH